MTLSPFALMLIGTGLNLMLVALLAGDKFVHKITGKAPLEARVEDIESAITSANSRFSDKMSKLTIYMEERRREVEDIARDLASLRGEMRGRTDTPNGDDRRDRRR